MVKTLKNFFCRIKKSVEAESWYIASGTHIFEVMMNMLKMFVLMISRSSSKLGHRVKS